MYFHSVLGIYLIPSDSTVYKQQCDSDQKISRSCVWAKGPTVHKKFFTGFYWYE